MTPRPWWGDERHCLIALGCVAEPLDPWVGRMVARVGAIETLDRIRSSEPSVVHRQGLRARLAALDLESELDLVERRGLRIVVRGDSEWPTQIEDLGERAPRALWIDGAANLRMAAAMSVSVVGARACTRYGAEVAYDLAGRLTAAGVHVISGGAFGIDAAAHRGALGAGGITVCVLASGVDVPYPRSHDALLARIAEFGAVVSESPLGSPVRRQRFLSRNRIIAALSRATIVVEAAARSGSLSTAHEAEAINRVVGAVPGPITSDMSRGTHQLMRDGRAVLVGSSEEIRELIQLDPAVQESPPERDSWFEGLSPAERDVLDAMPVRATVGLEELVLATTLSPQQVLSALGALDAHGRIRQSVSGWHLVAAPAGREALQLPR